METGATGQYCLVSGIRQAVSDTNFCQDIPRMARIRLNLSPQAGHERPQGSGILRILDAVDGLNDHLSREHFSGGLEEGFQQFVFQRRQVDLPAAKNRPVLIAVQCQLTDFPRRLTCCRTMPKPSALQKFWQTKALLSCHICTLI